MEILGRLFRNIVFTSVFVVFLFGFFVANAESIDSFNSHIIVNDNGTLNISEDIQYDFGSEVRHGIFRTLPLTTENGPQIKISNISVTDESGNLYNFVQSIDNNILNIKIGEADKTLSGKHLYTLRYDVVNAIRRFDTEDELYWNVTGSGWNVLINSANVQIDFPVQTDIKGPVFFTTDMLNNPCQTGKFMPVFLNQLYSVSLQVINHEFLSTVIR